MIGRKEIVTWSVAGWDQWDYFKDKLKCRVLRMVDTETHGQFLIHLTIGTMLKIENWKSEQYLNISFRSQSYHKKFANIEIACFLALSQAIVRSKFVHSLQMLFLRKTSKCYGITSFPVENRSTLLLNYPSFLRTCWGLSEGLS